MGRLSARSCRLLASLRFKHLVFLIVPQLAGLKQNRSPCRRFHYSSPPLCCSLSLQLLSIAQQAPSMSTFTSVPFTIRQSSNMDLLSELVQARPGLPHQHKITVSGRRYRRTTCRSGHTTTARRVRSPIATHQQEDSSIVMSLQRRLLLLQDMVVHCSHTS